MSKKDNTLFYVLAVILVFILISWMKDRNKKDKDTNTKNTSTEKEPTMIDPTTGEGIYLPDDYDPTKDAPIVVNPGGIMATIPDDNKGNAVDVINNGLSQINNAVVKGYTV